MPSLKDPRSKKRQRDCLESSHGVSPPLSKKPKIITETEATCAHRPPRFWDTLSKVRLSRGSIREFERRTSGNTQKRQRLHPPSLQSLAVELPRELGRFSRHGGPNLAYLRGFGSLAAVNHRMSSNGLKRPSAGSKKSSKSKSSPYNGDFEQKLIDNGIYLNNRASKPGNLEDIREHLARRRPSLSPSRFDDIQFEEFTQLCERAANEASTMADIIPIIAGEGRRRYNSMTDAQFTNMSPLLEDVTAPKPDVYDGARPEQIDPRVRHSLGSHIIPSKKTNYPAVPNFYLEGKSAAGRADVAKRQACYDGAIGTRAIHTLQNYRARQPIYDGNAYSYSSTYHAGTGTLKTYAHHPTAPKIPGGQLEYHTTQIGGYDMTHNRERFCEGAAAFRYGRELAESHRNSFIEKANREARHASASSPSNTLVDSQDSRSVVYHESDTSADELAVEDLAKKRHRHGSRTGQSSGGHPPTLSKSNSRHEGGEPRKREANDTSKHGGRSRHTGTEAKKEVKRRAKPTQKSIDNRQYG